MPMGAEQSTQGEAPVIHKVHCAPTSVPPDPSDPLVQLSKLAVPQPLLPSRENENDSGRSSHPHVNSQGRGIERDLSSSWNDLTIATLHRLESALVESGKAEGVLKRQRQLMRLVDSSGAAIAEIEQNLKEKQENAKIFGNALDRAQRLALVVGDVQDQLERSVATANILGASHFPEDEELCSFRNFLKCNPINTQRPSDKYFH